MTCPRLAGRHTCTMPRSLTHAAYILAFTALCILGACAHAPGNPPLPGGTVSPNAGYRFEEIPATAQDDELFVCLAFSGGGSRAAAFAYGVLEKLHHMKLRFAGRETTLLEQVDCISSISGGSFPAAYYGLRGDAIFTEFRPKFVDRDIEGDLALRALNPVNTVRLLSPYFDRIDVAAELYNDTVFDGATYAHMLARNERPFIIVNATDLAIGKRFEFTQDQFDVVGSDLAGFPVARAVAASSAFPILLSPLTIQKHPVSNEDLLRKRYAKDHEEFYTNRRAYEFDWSRREYLRPDKRWVHLMDGGLADNTGLRAVDHSLRAGFIRSRLERRRIRHLAVITVNAYTRTKDEESESESGPGTGAVDLKTMTTAMDDFTLETVEGISELLNQVREEFGGVQTYAINLEFEGIEDKTERDYLWSIPTSFYVSPAQADRLIAVSRQLFRAHPDFRRLQRDLNITW